MKYTPTEVELARIEKAFNYTVPTEDQAERLKAILVKAKELALLIAGNCPASQEKQSAFMHLQTCVQMCGSSMIGNE